MDYKEGYEAYRNEALGHWYIVHRQWKGNVFHRNILPDNYESEAAAEEAATAMRGALR